MLESRPQDVDLDQDLNDALVFLQDASSLAFISGLLPEGELKVELYRLGMTIKETITFINKQRLKLRDEMFYHVAKMVIFLNIDMSRMNRLVSNMLNIDVDECLVTMEYAVSLAQTMRQSHQRDILLNDAFRSAKTIWDSKILNSLSTYHL